MLYSNEDMRFLKRDPFVNIANDMVVDYPSPANISYLWNFGSLAGLFLGVQLVTGIILAMHYTPHMDLAFNSIEHIMRDVNYGWFLRYCHANGASFFFLMLYAHILRGLYYGSYIYPRALVWHIGVAIYLLTMAAGFLGYILVWGQMSYWAATVIINLVSVVPLIGNSLTEWIWGGFSVGNPTLNRLFSLHYLVPFIIAVLAILHLMALHIPWSGTPLGTNSKVDMVPFHPYFSVKDGLGVLVLLVMLSYLVFFNPNLLGEPDNYIPANPMATPPHIVPDWYFLPFYAILRSIPSKFLGVIAMAAAILVLFLLPYLNTSRIRSSTFRPIFKKFYWLFVVCVLLLSWIGGIPVQEPYYTIGQIATLFYFTFLLLLIPVIGMIENTLMSSR